MLLDCAGAASFYFRFYQFPFTLLHLEFFLIHFLLALLKQTDFSAVLLCLAQCGFETGNLTRIIVLTGKRELGLNSLHFLSTASRQAPHGQQCKSGAKGKSRG